MFSKAGIAESFYRSCKSSHHTQKDDRAMKIPWLAGLLLLSTLHAVAQDSDTETTHAGYVPVISGGMGYVHTVSGGVTTLEPQINPILLLPIGSHVLIESRTDFTGFFQRRFVTTGDFTGQVFKTVEFAQIDWLANSHVQVVAGKYLLPFGLYSERLSPLWIRNLQDQPLSANVGTETTGGGDGGMLRGVIAQTKDFSIQYSTYFSAHSGIHEIDSARTAGMDASIYFPKYRFEVGSSYQRFLESRRINSEAEYISWQPKQIPLDLKAEYDRSFYGQGYWLEGAYMLSQVQPFNRFFRNVQLVARSEQAHPFHGGGNGLPRVDTKRGEFGLNYYVRDNLRFISSYGRQFSSTQNSNIWNVGFTYRFLWPLWPEKK